MICPTRVAKGGLRVVPHHVAHELDLGYSYVNGATGPLRVVT